MTVRVIHIATLGTNPEADRIVAIAYAAANHTKWFWGGVYQHGPGVRLRDKGT